MNILIIRAEDVIRNEESGKKSKTEINFWKYWYIVLGMI